MRTLSKYLSIAALLTMATTAPCLAASHTPSPTSSHRFSVEVDGSPISQVTRAEFLQGPALQTAAGSSMVGVLRIKRLLAGAGGNTDFLSWRQQTANGKFVRRSVSLILLSAAGSEAARVNLYNCTAMSWSGPDLAAGGEERPLTESLDVACDSVELKGSF